MAIARLPCSAKHPGGFSLRPPGDGSPTCIADYLNEGDSTMLFSSLRSAKASRKRPAPFRLAVEHLDDRICPTSPHFISATSSVAASGALVVDFKEAGLGDNQNIDYQLTGDVNATFGLVNNGGNVVQGQPWSSTNTLLASGTFNSGDNGNITATLTSQTPSDPNLKVPNGNGWHVVFDISYTNLVLTDTTNNVSTSVPDASLNTFPT
jgi:hypothetical protein